MIASAKANVRKSYFLFYTFLDFLKNFLPSAHITFLINKILYKAKFQKRPVINYLARHKNLWCWIQKHIWTIEPIKTGLWFHLISIHILLEDINALTHNTLYHRLFFLICGKYESIYSSWGFPNISHIWKKRQGLM